MEDTDLTFGDVTDPYENDDPDRADGIFDMDTPNDPEPMPAATLVGATVRDPSTHVEGFYGRAGGTFDPEFGVLELVFEPCSEEELAGDDGLLPAWVEDQHAETTVRFVEVERLLEVLAGLEFSGAAGQIPNREWVRRADTEWWRTVLAEKLDAHKL